jgi:hypothetical protein
MSLDLDSDYSKAKSQIGSINSYLNLKDQYDAQRKKAGDSFESAKEKVSSSIDKVKKETKRFQKQVKNQLDQLLDINNVTGGKGAGSVAFIKKLLLKTLKIIEPLISEILNQEAINVLGCDQQQTYSGGTTLYIKVQSIDLFGLLKKAPTSEEGKLLYEKNPIQVQIPPFSMNRELYKRTQNENNSFENEYGDAYKGYSGQELFDIDYVEQNNFGITGPWFKITLKNRANGINKVASFLLDYYKSIRLVEFPNIMVCIMEALTGCISISGDIGLKESEDQTRFALILQRILGLCFDNAKEIDVTGVSKLAELDGIDDSFFEFTDIDLRNIEQKVSNIKNKVVQYENCGNILLPVNAPRINAVLNELFFVGDENIVDRADSLTNYLTDDEEWRGLTIDGNIQAAVDFNFIKLIAQGLLGSLITPKILLPIFIMFKALGQEITDGIRGLMDFARLFKRFVVNLVSRIGAIFVKELFELVVKNIKSILQRVIEDLAKEKADVRIIIILKLIQLLIVVAEFISDWRRCKSVVDEILWLLKIATSGFGVEIPYPLLLAARFLDGYSETRAFIATIEEMQKLGIPTGPMPDGSPNLGVLAMFSQIKGMNREEASNGKVVMAIDPISLTPAGLTNGITMYGKKL